MTEPKPLYPAPFFRRLVALCIDLVIYYAFYYGILFIAGRIFRLLLQIVGPFAVGLPRLQLALIYNSVSLFTLLVVFGLPIFVYLDFIRKTGTSIGKAAMQLHIRSATAAPLQFKQVLIREVIGKPISLLYFGLGFFWSIWDKDHQGWHDKLAKTQVVSSHPDTVGVRGAYLFMGVALTAIIAAAVAWGLVMDYAFREMNKLELEQSNYDDILVIQDALTAIEKRNPDGTLLCNGISGSCESDDRDEDNYFNREKVDGTGWVTVNFANLGYKAIRYLPSGNYKTYRYCSDGRTWEISITFDDPKRYSYLARDDGGNNPSAFEIGSNKLLCK